MIISFREMGYRRPTSRPHLDKLLSEINSYELPQQVTLDLRWCMFSYPLASILEAVVNGMVKHESGELELKIIHGYRTVTPNHLVNYLTKKTALGIDSVKTIDELKNIFYIQYKITLIIEGGDYDF